MKGTYQIWLADNPTFMDFTPEDRTLSRTRKGCVEADNLDDAFSKSQNGIGNNWEQFGTRSCSVGDVIEDPNGQFHFIKEMGFETIKTPSV